MTMCSTGPCWTASTYNGTNFTAQAVAYFNNLYIIGGQNSTNGNSVIHYSSDGINWTRVDAGYAGGGGVKSFASGNGILIGIVNFDKHITSTDGINWTIVAHWPPVSAEVGFAFGAGNFVLTFNAVDRVAYSPTGSPGSWNSTNCAPGSFGYMNRSRIYGGGLFVTTGTDGFSYSPDVTTPVTAVAIPGVGGGTPTEIAYGNGVYVANSTIGRNIYRSTNGTSWTLLTDALPPLPGFNSWSGIIHSQGYFICAVNDSNILAISADGITWTLTTSEHYFDSASNVGFPIMGTDDDGQYIAASTLNSIAQFGVCPCATPITYGDYWAQLTNVTIKNVSISVSPTPFTDCINGPCWTLSLPPANFEAQSVSIFADKYILGGINSSTGGAQIQYSLDGTTWSTVDLGNQAGDGVQKFAVGNGIIIGMINAVVHARSTDGINWTLYNHYPPVIGKNSLAFGNGFFVFQSGDSLAYSSDGINWNSTYSVNSGGYMSDSLTYGAGLYVGCGYDGFCYTTSVTTPVTKVSGTPAQVIAYGNGAFVAINRGTFGNVGNVYRSTDGMNWTTHTSVLPVSGANNQYYDLTFSQGRFIACKFDSNELAISEDGITWTLTTGSSKFNSSSVEGAFYITDDDVGNYLAVKVNLDFTAFQKSSAQIGVCPC